MKKYLGIDFGLRHVGVAVSYGILAEPLTQIQYEMLPELIQSLVDLIEEHAIDEIVLGISENQMGQKTRAFGDQLKETIHKPIHFYDETLSSQEARQLMVHAQLKRKKRQQKDHQAAAAVILQHFLDDISFQSR